MRNVKKLISKIVMISATMLVLCFSLLGNTGESFYDNIMLTVKAEETNEQSGAVTYYVSTLGNDANIGTAMEAPFQTVDYAIEKAMDGDVIVIVDSATANDTTSSDAPLVIDKNLTIRGESSTEELAILSLRAGGIILGADVSFENLKVGAASFLRPGIAANGHTLRLKNVHQDTSLRPLQIYGGTFYDYSDEVGTGKDYGESYRGEESNLIIIGGSFEGIYAGSTNGSFSLPVNIIICETDPSNLDMKYDFSVNNGIFAGSVMKNPNDTNTSGQIPVLDSSISLNTTVNISVQDNAFVKKISGVLEEHTVHLSTNGAGYYSYDVAYLDSVKVEGGTFALTGQFGTTTSNVPDIILTGSAENKATIDLSEFDQVVINNFTGSDNGILVLYTYGVLTIEGTISEGITEFRTSGGLPWSSAENPGNSGWMEYEYQYIHATKGEGGFVITNPYDTQAEDIAFTPESGVEIGGWITVASIYAPPELIEFTPQSVTVSYEEANITTDGIHSITVSANPIYSEDEWTTELGYVPIEYQITYANMSGDVTAYKEQASILDEEGYYYCDYKRLDVSNNSNEVLLKFVPIGDDIYLYAGSNGLEAGVYTITMSAPTVSGIMTKTFTLTVLEKSIGETLEGYSISLDGNINVKYHFSFSKELTDYANVYAQITLPNGTKETVLISEIKEKAVSNTGDVEDTKYYIDVNGYYVFTCEVAAKEMASDIKVVFVADEEQKSREYIYTVKDYAEDLIDYYKNTDEKLVNLVNALLNYGAYAQKYFGFNTGYLANEKLDAAMQSETYFQTILDNPEDYFVPMELNYPEVNKIGTFTKANLTLETLTTLNVYFKPADGVSVEDLSFTLNGTTSLTPVQTGTDGEYLLKVSDIKAQKLGDTCEFVVTLKKDNTDKATLSYNALAYGYNMVTVTYKQDIKNLCAALYEYYSCAKTYVQSK